MFLIASWSRSFVSFQKEDDCFGWRLIARLCSTREKTFVLWEGRSRKKIASHDQPTYKQFKQESNSSYVTLFKNLQVSLKSQNSNCYIILRYSYWKERLANSTKSRSDAVLTKPQAGEVEISWNIWKRARDDVQEISRNDVEEFPAFRKMLH